MLREEGSNLLFNKEVIMETDKQPLPSRSSFTLSLKAIMFPFHAKRLYTIKLFMWSKTMRHISIKLSCRLFSSFVLWFIFQMHYTKYCKDLLSNSAVEQVLIISIHFQFQNQYNNCCNVNSLKMGNGKNLTPCRQELVMERHDTALHQ